MEYRERLPIQALRPFVRCLWSLFDAAPAAEVERIVPDGCAEIVLHRAAPYQRLTERGARRQPRALVIGQLRGPLRLRPAGSTDLVAIRFEPAGLYALLGVPMTAFLDQDIPLEAVDAGLHADLGQAAARASRAEALGALEAELLQHYTRRTRRACDADTLAARAAQLGSRASACAASLPSAPSVRALARRMHVSARTLERAFRNEVGCTPKLFLRVQRLQGVLQQLERHAPTRGWADVALRHGYADQSHLIRDFSLLAGTTPARHVAERSPLAASLAGAGVSHSSNPDGRPA